VGDGQMSAGDEQDGCWEM